MYHLNRLTRFISYFSGLLLIIYFVASGVNIGEYSILLYIVSAWFCLYGLLLANAKQTVAYYKIFIIINVLTIIAGYGMHFMFNSQAGYMIIVISIIMLAFIITFSRR
jgi:hypothetical protein